VDFDYFMAGEMTRNIDQRLRRVGHDQDRRRRRDLDQPWHDILEHLYIGVEKTKPFAPRTLGCVTRGHLGEQVVAHFDLDKVTLFDPKTENVLR
jgi:hypothetical protein